MSNIYLPVFFRFYFMLKFCVLFFFFFHIVFIARALYIFDSISNGIKSIGHDTNGSNKTNKMTKNNVHSQEELVQNELQKRLHKISKLFRSLCDWFVLVSLIIYLSIFCFPMFSSFFTMIFNSNF